MSDPLKARLEKIRKASDSAKRRASLYTDLSKFNDKSTVESLRCTRKAAAPGKKMQKIGMAMVLAPEPVTTPIGIALIAAGTFFEKKYNSSTILDIGHHTKSNLSAINDFKNSIS